jgi:hypothetical protein
MFSQILSYFEEDDNSSFFYISTSVACAKCELVTQLIFPFKIIFLGDLIELPMAKITQNSLSIEFPMTKITQIHYLWALEV